MFFTHFQRKFQIFCHAEISAQNYDLLKKKCQKMSFLSGGHGSGENRQTYDGNDEKS